MKSTVIKSSSRGHANHGWLDTCHTFSFANYYDPDRMGFGALRVVNDDIVAGGEGFGRHPHDNMEIVSIPLYGELEHQDSMGNRYVIHSGEVQVMSAGTGITHSEYNASDKFPVNFFQIWIFPNKNGVEPRYQQMKFDLFELKNQWVQLVSPNPDDAGVWIYQDAWLFTCLLDKVQTLDYTIKQAGNGIFAMVIDGECTIAGQYLERRDAVMLSEADTIQVEAHSPNARVLLIDVPVNIH
jgi:redox-sensitive bicupin YhaK (pirin superfamily)